MIYMMRFFWHGGSSISERFSDTKEAAAFFAFGNRERAFSETLTKTYQAAEWPSPAKYQTLIEYDSAAKVDKILAAGKVIPIATLHEQIVIARREGMAIEETAWEQQRRAAVQEKLQRKEVSEAARPHRRWDNLDNSRTYASTGRHAYKAAMAEPVSETEEDSVFNVRIKPLRKKPLERERNSTFQSNWKSQKVRRQYMRRKTHQDTITIDKRAAYYDAENFDDIELIVDLDNVVVG